MKKANWLAGMLVGVLVLLAPLSGLAEKVTVTDWAGMLAAAKNAAVTEIVLAGSIGQRNLEALVFAARADGQTRKVTIEGEGEYAGLGSTGHGSVMTFGTDADWGDDAMPFDVTIKDIRIMDGVGDQGGALFVQGQLTLENCVFWTNQADQGGAIYVRGDLDMTGGDMWNNKATESGGAVYVTGNATLDGVEIRGNVIRNGTGPEGKGGGIAVDGFATVTDSKITDNWIDGDGYGGGLYAGGGASITGGEIAGNEAYNAGTGGGVYVDGDVSLSGGALVSGNQARSDGGGLYVTGDAEVSDATIEWNSAINGDGGGLYVIGDAEVSDATIDKNKAGQGGDGGGLYVGGDATVRESTVTENEAWESGGGLYVDGDVRVEGGSFMDNVGRLGGAIVADGHTVRITDDVVFEGNSADGNQTYQGELVGIYAQALEIVEREVEAVAVRREGVATAANKESRYVVTKETAGLKVGKVVTVLFLGGGMAYLDDGGIVEAGALEMVK